MGIGYIRDIWDCGDTAEVEEKHTGKYGAPGQLRGKKRKATKEEISRQNQWKKERDVRRAIKWNFNANDYWITITYRKKQRPTWQQMRDDMRKLIRKVRERYRILGFEMKYFYRLGIGKQGGPHMHILVNRIVAGQQGTDTIFSQMWDKGHVNFRTTYEAGGFKDLARYITKPLEEWEPEDLKRYSPSRNLIRKEPKQKVINRRSLIDKMGQVRYPKAPKGYYIDPDSVRMGINPITGFPYRHYTIVKIRKEGTHAKGRHVYRD